MLDIRIGTENIKLSLENLAQCVAVELPGTLAPIQASDIQIYKERFAREQRQASYSHAWSYIIQACRNFMLRYLSDDLLISIGFHQNRFVFVSILGLNERSLPEFLHFTQLMYEVHPHPIYLKKVFTDHLPHLNHGNWETTEHYPWDLDAPSDEDTFPEIIANLDLALDYVRPWEEWKELYQSAIQREISYEHLQFVKRRRKDFRNELAVFERMQFEPSIEDYRAEDCQDVLDFLAHYFQNNPENIYAYHNLLNPELMLPNSVQIARVNGKVAGLWVLEELDAQSYGLYAAVFSRDRELSGISEALYRRIFQQLRAKGVDYLALGGCELEKLYRFKLKFAPQEERQMQMLVYTGVHWWYSN